MKNTNQNKFSPLRELLEKIWNDYIKNWIDYRKYLWQRAIILNIPFFNISTEIKNSKDWKSPLAFAIQGVLLLSILSQIISLSFDLIYKKPDTILLMLDIYNKEIIYAPLKIPSGSSKRDVKFEQVRKDILLLERKTNKIRAAMPTEYFYKPVRYSERFSPILFYSDYPFDQPKILRDQALKEFQREIDILRMAVNQNNIYPYVNKIRKFLRPIYIPASLVASAYLFHICLGILGPKNWIRPKQSYDYYLYAVTGSLFWVNVANNLFFGITSKFLYYNPPSFESEAAKIGQTIDSIDNSFFWILSSLGKFEVSLFIAKLIFIIWSYVIIRNVAVKLMKTFKMQPARNFWNMYSGEKKIRKDMIFSMITIYLVFGALMSAGTLSYGYLMNWLSQFKI